MKPRKSPSERLIEAQTAKLVAEFDILAERAAAAGMPQKQVRAIRCALDLAGLLDCGDDVIEAWRCHLDERIEEHEVIVARRDIGKAEGTT